MLVGILPPGVEADCVSALMSAGSTSQRTTSQTPSSDHGSELQEEMKDARRGYVAAYLG